METKRKNELIYLFAYFIYTITEISQISTLININSMSVTIIHFLVMLLLVVKILNQKYTLKQLIIYSGIIFFAIYFWWRMKSALILITAFFFIGIKDVKIRKIIKVDAIVKISFSIIHISLYLLNYAKNPNFIYSLLVNYTETGVLKHTLYFTHSSNAGSVIAWALIDIMILCKPRKKNYVILNIAEMVAFYFTRARTAFYSFIIFEIIFLVCMINNKLINKILNGTKKYIFIALTTFNLLFSIIDNFLDNKKFEMLNKLLSKRLSYSQIAIKKYGIHMFPNYINDGVLDNIIWVDNFYIRCIINYGIVILIILNMIYIYINHKKEKTTNNYETAILILFPIALFSELYPFNLARTVMILIIANICINSHKGEKNEGLQGKYNNSSI